MKKTAQAGDTARIRIVAPTAAMATGLVTPLALAGPGDLDPSFGKVGRVSDLPGLSGQAWSLDAREGDILFGGFNDYCYYYCDYTGFVSRLDADGGRDEAFAAAILEATEVHDVAMLPDGSAVAVATRLGAVPKAMVVFRLKADGALDTSFGVDGISQIPAPDGVNAQGTALLLESDGRITVAGVQGGKLVLARLLPNGSLDTSFGTEGSFVWNEAIHLYPLPKLVRAGSGYRVLVHVLPGACRVLALTGSGALDAGFGTGGLAIPVASGGTCAAIGTQADGRVVVAGTSAGDSKQSFVARLLSTGAVDPLFRTDGASGELSSVTALAVGSDDSIALAGRDKSGLPGALIVRLQADGMLDLLFGRNGSTSLAVESDWAQWPQVNDMQVLADGGVVMSGGISGGWGLEPFVARLLGNVSAGGPGVADIPVTQFETSETDGSVDVSVRRIGGRTGAVSVEYEAVTGSATAAEDFAAVKGQLTWADGDDSDKVITVPILADKAGEGIEGFSVELSAPGGGMGLATRKAWVTIRGDSYPAGFFTLDVPSQVWERGYTVNVIVNRLEYGTGAVTVDVTVGGTATNGEDYSLPQQTFRLSWADGDRNPKNLPIPLVNDRRQEGEETITVTLSGATGGALIGTPSSATVKILDDDQSSGGGGGGGHAGGLFALLSGLAGLLRLRRRTAG